MAQFCVVTVPDAPERKIDVGAVAWSSAATMVTLYKNGEPVSVPMM
jgi:hypothetical protein